MRQLLDSFLRGRAILIAVAAPAEAQAVLSAHPQAESQLPEPWTPVPLSPRLHLVMTGIGKVNAAAATARAFNPQAHAAVLNCGIAGALPVDARPVAQLGGLGGTALASAARPTPRQAPVIGTVILASSCIYADEGIETPRGFSDCAAMGFPLGDFPASSVPVSAPLLDVLRPLADLVAPIATVSTCSGTDARAREVAARTSAPAEAMEGAAVAHVCHRLGIPMAELRVISNTTGDRDKQRWDMKAALAKLTDVIGRLV